MSYSKYRIYRRAIYMVGEYGNSAEYYDKRGFRSTNLTLKARTHKEAQRKAEKIWERGEYGNGSILALRESP